MPLNRADALSYLEEIRDGCPFENARIDEHSQFPEYWPVIRNIAVDDTDRIWISSYREPGLTGSQWWLLDIQSGQIVGTVDTEDKLSIYAVRDDRVYGVVTNENGEDEVAFYKLETMNL